MLGQTGSRGSGHMQAPELEGVLGGAVRDMAGAEQWAVGGALAGVGLREGLGRWGGVTTSRT